jgi:hypothetical protein
LLKPRACGDETECMERNGRRARTGTLRLADFQDIVAGSGAAGDDRRRDPRRSVARRIVILTCVGSERDWSFQSVELTDCSTSGVGLSTAKPMTVGDHFLAKLKLDQPRLVVYTIRRCEAAGERFRIGAELTNVIGMPADSDASAVVTALLGATAAPTNN